MDKGTAVVYATDAASLDYIAWPELDAFASYLAANVDEDAYLNLELQVIFWQESRKAVQS